MMRSGNRKRQRDNDSVECSYQNCTKAKWIEPRTGITHAEFALRDGIPAPHGACHTCHYRGCDEPVYFDDDGRVHDFCSKSHAARAMDEGTWPKSLRSCQGQATPTNKCSLPGCSAPCFRDHYSGETLDFCGRTHAKSAHKAGMLGRSEALEPEHVEVVFSGTNSDGRPYSVSMLNRTHSKYEGVKEQFQSSWRHDSKIPTIVRIFQIQNGSNVHDQYSSYRDELESRHGFISRNIGEVGNEMRRFHGTSTDPVCTFGINDRSRPCSSSSCSVCRICSDSFKIKYAGKSGGQVMALRYGEGLYFSATSSKSNDYAIRSEKMIGSEAYRMMFLCKVAVGEAFLAKEDEMSPEDIKEKVLDRGFDSLVGLTDRDGGKLNHDEIVVYEDVAAVPSYLIVYKM